jgi:plasmid stabilization system protein ParE
MAFRVKLVRRAVEDIETIYRRVIARAPIAGQRWYNALIETLFSLESFPERGQIVGSLSTPSKIVRRVLHGRRSHTYRIYFDIAGDTIRILHVRHGARREPKISLP